MSNRLWAEHVKPKSFWKRLPTLVKVVLFLSLAIGGAYGAVQVISHLPGVIHVKGTGLTVTVSASFAELNITNPLIGKENVQQNATWAMQNTGQVPLSIRYSTDLPFNLTLLMVTTGQVDFQGKTLVQGASTSGWFNLTAGHFTAVDPINFVLTVQGCYPIGNCS